ncbi:S1C family serine protease [Pontiella sulfatireligans]|uniref:S1C family serine protease n=1 Tax=Pontiella sulfatireligans TaxID=2750658 RepID=UPI0038B6339B
MIPKDGYILTNNHVVKEADRITVTLGDGRKFDAKMIGTDPKSEVALLKAERGLRRINLCKDMKKLAENVKSFSPPPLEEGEKALPFCSTLDQEPATEYKP